MVLRSKSSYNLPKSATGKGRRQGRQRKQEWEGRLQAITSLRKHRGGKKELLNKLHQAEHVMNVSSLTLPPKTRLSSLVRVTWFTLSMEPWLLSIQGRCRQLYLFTCPASAFAFLNVNTTKHPSPWLYTPPCLTLTPRSPALFSCYMFAYYVCFMKVLLAKL